MYMKKFIYFFFTIQSAANNDYMFQIFYDIQFKQLIIEEIM
jgi:hypothetical protein